MKIIIEAYPNRNRRLEMPDPIFDIITDLYDKSNYIGHRLTITEIFKQLPEELRRQVEITDIDPTVEINGVDFKIMYFDEFNYEAN